MTFKLFKFVSLIVAVAIAISFIFVVFNRLIFVNSNDSPDAKISVKNNNLDSILKESKKISTTTNDSVKTVKPENGSNFYILPPIKSKVIKTDIVNEVSSKSFEELINSSVIQLYCGNLNLDETTFSDISRGTGIIISESGKVLTNRHVIYDDNAKKIKNNCFILKSPFPNVESRKPKIYYAAEIINYPLTEKFSDFFSKDKYYNDFAILKIIKKPETNSKINLLLGFDLAAPEDYLIIENNNLSDNEARIFNFLPIDWDYQPKDGDIMITLGYGVDASRLANQITSTIGKIAGNININKKLEPQILLIESNATSGFSGGALINPQSKGLVGLISWITAGDITGKYTVAIFRDFLRSLMLADFNFDLKLLQN